MEVILKKETGPAIGGVPCASAWPLRLRHLPGAIPRIAKHFLHDVPLFSCEHHLIIVLATFQLLITFAFLDQGAQVCFTEDFESF